MSQFYREEAIRESPLQSGHRKLSNHLEHYKENHHEKFSDCDRT